MPSNYTSKHGQNLPTLLPPPSFRPQANSEQSCSGFSSNSSSGYSTPLAYRRPRSHFSEPPRPDSSFVPPPPAPDIPRFEQIGHYSPPYPHDDELMSSALVTRSASTAPRRAPDHRPTSFPGANDLPPGLPATATFVAAHHCSGCGRPRSHAYHKENPLIPNQIAAASFCRKCEKKLQTGTPIDSIVMPIREYASEAEEKPRWRRRSRERADSRTRVVIRYQSAERSDPEWAEAEDSPRPAQRGRSISFRHVPSRNVSRAAPKKPEEGLRRHISPPPSPPSRRWSPPPRRSGYMIEPKQSKQDHGASGTHKADRKPIHSKEASTSRSERQATKDGHDSLGIYVKEEHVRFEPRSYGSAPLSHRSRTSEATSQYSRHSEAPPPLGLSAVQSKRSSSPPAQSAKSRSHGSHSAYDDKRVIVVRRSPSPERTRKIESSEKASASLLSSPDYKGTTVPTTQPRGSSFYKTGKVEEQSLPKSRPNSGYHRYREYHNRPPSPPPRTSPTDDTPRSSKHSAKAPTVEYLSGNFKQNPNPAETKAYIERSVVGSKAPTKVTFTDSEVTSVDGVRIQDDRYVTRSVEEVKVESRRTGRRSDQRRKERHRSSLSPPTFTSGFL